MLTLSRKHVLLLLVPLAALLVLAGQRLAGADATRVAEPAAQAELVAVDGAGTAETAKLVVHVSGAVLDPGLYEVDDGARVADAVERAGGLKPRADLSALNLAAPLADGQHVIVPRRVAGVAAGGAASVTTGAKVQLSTATVDQLDELPGVGPVTAQKIVDWRTANGAYQSVDDLDQIPGIGPARIEQLRDLVLP